MNKQSQKIVLAITASILAAVGAQAYDLNLGTNLPPVTFHGFASQGFLDSSKYNYLGDTTRGSFLFTEAGLNASFNPFPRTHIAVQAFTFDVGQNVGKYDVTLDYASADYTFNDYFGIRGGRIRRPEGIYNSIQDVDLARTFVLLPQGMYDARWRDFYVTLDGGEIFGSIPLSKAGSISYEAYLGLSHPALDGGLAQTIGSSLPPGSRVDDINSPASLGEQLWWNTPWDGLRVGIAYQHVFEARQDLSIATPFGTFPNASVVDVDQFQGSLEYLWKSWTFQTEYQRTWLEPGAISDTWYISAAYRFNKWFETGAYYTEYYNNVRDRDNSKLFQKDAALSLRFDPTDWWVFKIEGHCIQGTGLLDDNVSNPPNTQDSRLWFMLALKTTFSF